MVLKALVDFPYSRKILLIASLFHELYSIYPEPIISKTKKIF